MILGGKRLQVGERSGSLILKSIGRYADERKVASTYVLHCYCERCGKDVEVYSTDFRRRQMCHECSIKNVGEKNVTHGASRRGDRNYLYGAWKQMLTRCSNPNTASYRWYGAKGINVCAEWQDFSAFREWALSHGYGPGMTLDRKRATEGYSPDNCEYVTKPENSRRMRREYVFVRKTDRAVIYATRYDEPTYGDY